METTYPVSYALVGDLYSVISNIGSVTNVTSTDIAYQIGRVQANINARLAGLYTLPFSTVPLLLTTITTDLTIYELSKKFAIFQKNNEGFEKYYTQSNFLLDQIISNKIPLLDSSLQVISQKSTSGNIPWSNTRSFTPTFNEQDMEEQLVDSDKWPT